MIQKSCLLAKPLSILLLVSSISYAAEQPFEHRQVPTTTTTTSDCQELSEEDAQYLEQLLQENFPLHTAAQKGDLRAVKLLIRSTKVDVNEKGNYGFTSLHKAAQSGHHEVVQLLISVAPETMAMKDNYDMLPLHWAAQSGHHEVVQLLIHAAPKTMAMKDDIGNTPAHYAAEIGRHEVVQLLIFAAPETLTMIDNVGYTPLQRAAKNGHQEVAYLIENWYIFKAGLHKSLLQLLAAHHPRCGTQSPISTIVPHDWLQKICSYLRPGCCIYSPEQIKFYVELAQRFIKQHDSK